MRRKVQTVRNRMTDGTFKLGKHYFKPNGGHPLFKRKAIIEFIAENGGGFTTRDTGVLSRPPWRGAPRFPASVGNGNRMEARQRAIRIFSGAPSSSRAPRGLPSGFT